MQWFKHFSDANRNVSLRKLKQKYGIAGYGLYWHIVELIAYDLKASKLTFQLEHDSELIAMDTGLSREMVEEMVSHMVSLKLFENIDGTISCLKLAKILDETTAKSQEFRNLKIKLRDQYPDLFPIVSGEAPEKLRKVSIADIDIEEELEKEKELEEEKKKKAASSEAAKSTRQKKFPISENYAPNARAMELILAYGISEKFALSLIPEFIFFWQERGDRRVGWDATFINHCKAQFDRQGKSKPTITQHNIEAAKAFLGE